MIMREKLLEIKKIVEELLEKTRDVKEEKNSHDVKEEKNSHDVVERIEKPVFVRTKEFDVLSQLLNSEDWPEAVFSSQIADENLETDKEERAEGICDIILPPIIDKKFLDFGCGEGHVAKYMAKNSSFSVGYDINKNPKSQLIWEETQENFLLTTNFDKVKENAPYDVILLYDVMDHTEGESNVELLLKIKSILAENGNVYVRCHPWTGRHGGHIYKKINKAFVHLVFNEEELNELGVENIEYNNKYMYPIKFYDETIDQSGFKRINKEIDTQEVESFFANNPLIKQRIIDAFKIKTWTLDPPVFQMSLCFVDYILKKQ
jgi:2-polyprenyl-3-methyl-5-hydroxy-6-metoxy-1,4-benzoquinol methylase